MGSELAARPKHPLMLEAIILHGFGKEVLSSTGTLPYMIFCKALWSIVSRHKGSVPEQGWNRTSCGAIYLFQELGGKADKKCHWWHDGHYFVTQAQQQMICYTRCWSWRNGFAGDRKRSERGKQMLRRLAVGVLEEVAAGEAAASTEDPAPAAETINHPLILHNWMSSNGSTTTHNHLMSKMNP